MPTPEPSDDSSPDTRPSLLRRVRDWQDAASWAEFHAIYRHLIYGLARRSGLTHADAEDVTQDVFKRLAETIHQFEAHPARGSFRAWLMTLTRWRIADHRERQRRPGDAQVPATAPADTSTDTGSPLHPIEQLPAASEFEPAWQEEWETHLLDMACARLARRVKEKHYQVFELYARRGRSVLDVARTLRINPASVYLIGSRLTRQLKTEVAALRLQLEHA
jgi:RNA polymerase sigma-70 factor (ECF subfamily)